MLNLYGSNLKLTVKFIYNCQGGVPGPQSLFLNEISDIWISMWKFKGTRVDHIITPIHTPTTTNNNWNWYLIWICSGDQTLQSIQTLQSVQTLQYIQKLQSVQTLMFVHTLPFGQTLMSIQILKLFKHFSLIKDSIMFWLYSYLDTPLCSDNSVCSDIPVY